MIQKVSKNENDDKILTVQAIECKHCEDTIWSRCRHDFRTCSCGKCSVDGGFDYIKVVGDIKNMFPKVVNLSDNPTRQQLYDDWNKGIDKYGLIKKYE